MFRKPEFLLRIEGAALFLLALFFYRSMHASWLFFFVLFLWPDLGILGYLANVRLGAFLYNFMHTQTLPIALAGLSVALHKPASLSFALIWLAHIGADRALAYGLKYPTFFQDTHLQRVNSN